MALCGCGVLGGGNAAVWIITNFMLDAASIYVRNQVPGFGWGGGVLATVLKR